MRCGSRDCTAACGRRRRVPTHSLPLSLQRAAGMPHSSPERELNYTRRMTQRLLDSAPEVVCSYPIFAGEEKLRVSPPDRGSPRNLGRFCKLSKPLCAGFSRLRFPLDQQPLGQAPPLAAGSLQRGGINTSSPTRPRVPSRHLRCTVLARVSTTHRTSEYARLRSRARWRTKRWNCFWRDMGSQRELLSRSAG